ncbi:protein kinase domain-containing protein [Carnimonas bestiolae]|uniref:protein kinase domain-containing protein n=1 Tax=Carnimonas bestiolae TaxID=3402172 RepID=UPI003F4AE06D
MAGGRVPMGLRVSVGQARLASERQQRSAVAVQLAEGDSHERFDACALIADSPWRNAIARQAADLAIKGFLADYPSTPAEWPIKRAATRVLLALNGWCFSQSRFVASGSYVSSLSALILHHDQGHLFHAGDTVVYRLRGAEIEQLTREHITDLGGYRYPSRALGMDASLDLDYLTLPLVQGDLFLFATQTVRGILLPSDYMQLIREHSADLDAACLALAERAAELAAGRGVSAESICFQLMRVDRLDDLWPAASDRDRLPLPPELAPGDEIDGYWIEELLSSGNQQRVYRVRDAASGDRLLMATPALEMSGSHDYLYLFDRQRDMLGALRSPHVNRLETSRRAPSYHYYLMRYIEGETLGQWIRQHADIGLAQRLEIGRQMTKAVSALHRREFLHQSLSPNSFVVDRHGQVVLTEFAACCPRDTPAEMARSLAQGAGINDFAAPEYWLGLEVGRRSDQYSLASIIYWLLSYSAAYERSGKGRPIAGMGRGGYLPYKPLAQKLRTEHDLGALEYVPLTRWVNNAPPSLDNLLRRAVSPKRSMRFRRLYELMVGLRRADAQTAQSRRRGSRQLQLWRAIALLLVFGWLISWWFK